MGCFSWICQECGEGIQSNSATGDHCELFLLKEGKVIQHISGNYNSYGSVFAEDGEVVEWKIEWDEVCDLDINGNQEDGIAAFHTKCWDGTIPQMQSEFDPDQGWGNEEEPREYYGKYS